MQFAALIYSTEGHDDTDWDTLIKQYGEFGEQANAAGVIAGGEALQPIATASCVKLRGGKTLVTDGPFAETKEQLGGFYLLNCKDLDEAIEWAAKIPSARYGTIEIRPIIVFDE